MATPEKSLGQQIGEKLAEVVSVVAKERTPAWGPQEVTLEDFAKHNRERAQREAEKDDSSSA